MSSKRCPKCGVFSPATAERCDCGQSLLGVGVGTGSTQKAPLAAIGGALMAIGVALWVFCFVAFDVSVALPPNSGATINMDRVANMERMDTRQNVVIVGGALFVAGAVLVASAVNRSDR